jgi:hypothetical protein
LSNFAIIQQKNFFTKNISIGEIEVAVGTDMIEEQQVQEIVEMNRHHHVVATEMSSIVMNVLNVAMNITTTDHQQQQQRAIRNLV